jgi:hypothetical protein
MEAEERRGPAEEVFSFRASAGGKVFLLWRGRTVKTLRGEEARRFLARIAGLQGEAAQLVMAKATGNFRRGNERRLGDHPRDG